LEGAKDEASSRIWSLVNHLVFARFLAARPGDVALVERRKIVNRYNILALVIAGIAGIFCGIHCHGVCGVIAFSGPFLFWTVIFGPALWTWIAKEDNYLSKLKLEILRELISGNSLYGVELVTHIPGANSRGLYGALAELVADGLLICRIDNSNNDTRGGRPRFYYQLTPSGRHAYAINVHAHKRRSN
jgi:DNA-binding HxlR family transcriptional regulator